jgi:hypothetical protein
MAVALEDWSQFGKDTGLKMDFKRSRSMTSAR